MTGDERAALRERLADERPLTWVLTGDSITHGIVHTHGGRSYPEHLHEVVRGDLGRARDALINTGVSGNRLADILGDWDHRVARWSPDVVTLMIGTNDCAPDAHGRGTTVADFTADLVRFVNLVRALDAIPALQTPPPVDAANAGSRAGIGEFVDAVRKVAHETDAILADHHMCFGRLGGGAMPWSLMGDPFHPNELGHAAIARELAAGLELDHADSPTLARLDGLIAGR